MKNISFEDAVKFHGHACAGLAIGYRVSQIALRELSSGRSEDEEFVAIVENNACGIDAIQIVCGCTFGKGNLIFKDHGKHVYTFYNRKIGKGVRIYAETFYMDDDDDKRFVELSRKEELNENEKAELENIKGKRIKRILNDPEEKYIRIDEPTEEIPHKARIFESFRCEICNEKAATPYIKEMNGKKICIPCSSKK